MKQLLKRTVALLLTFALLAVVLTGCNNDEEKIEEQQSETVDNAVIDICDEDGSYYSLMSKVTLDYYQGEVCGIYIENPAVLAFKVPDRYADGVGIADGTNVIDMVNRIDAFLQTNELDEKTADLLNGILSDLNDIVLLTYAST